MVSKFSKGKIYKIVSNNPDITEVYYGSTIQTLSMRMASHRSNYKRWLADSKNTCISIFPYFTQYKIEQFHIELVEDFSCENKNQLCARENYYIRNFDCVNKNLAPLGITRKEVAKQYRQEHKEEIRQHYQEYYQEHKEEKKEYYQEHKDEISQKHKVKISCGCGCDITTGSLYMHKKTKKHIAWLSTQAILQPGDKSPRDI